MVNSVPRSTTSTVGLEMLNPMASGGKLALSVPRTRVALHAELTFRVAGLHLARVRIEAGREAQDANVELARFERRREPMSEHELLLVADRAVDQGVAQFVELEDVLIREVHGVSSRRLAGQAGGDAI